MRVDYQPVRCMDAWTKTWMLFVHCCNSISKRCPCTVFYFTLSACCHLQMSDDTIRTASDPSARHTWSIRGSAGGITSIISLKMTVSNVGSAQGDICGRTSLIFFNVLFRCELCCKTLSCPDNLVKTLLQCGYTTV